MSLRDKPVSMTELGKAVVQDFSAVSQNKLSQEKNDLSAVWESMYEKGLRRKVSTQCYFNPEELEIPDHHKTTAKEPNTEVAQLRTDTISGPAETEEAEKQPDEDFKRDLASVHLDRAMNTSRANWHNQGRHYRRRRTLSKEDSTVKIPEH